MYIKQSNCPYKKSFFRKIYCSSKQNVTNNVRLHVVLDFYTKIMCIVMNDSFYKKKLYYFIKTIVVEIEDDLLYFISKKKINISTTI